MSKFLKFIVNLFLILAILSAVAILVPPLAGVTTTIVDTPAMNTNLPLGSITYSTDINVYDIKEGDEILKENDSSTYAYIIKETDPANGRFVAVSAADPYGVQEEIILRNTVSKVAVVVPFTGYVIMAMHSVEGIVIIVLVVVLMIIMFILSELWKHAPEEEEDEDKDKDKEGEEEPVQVSASEETGIDTAAIKEAVEENHAAVESEDSVLSAAAQVDAANEQDPYAGMSRSEKKAAMKAKNQEEQEASFAAENGNEDAAAAGIASAAALTGAAVIAGSSEEKDGEAASVTLSPEEKDSGEAGEDLRSEEAIDEDLSKSTDELYVALAGEKAVEEGLSQDEKENGPEEDLTYNAKGNAFEEDLSYDKKASASEEDLSYNKEGNDAETRSDLDGLFEKSADQSDSKTLEELASEMKERAGDSGTEAGASADEFSFKPQGAEEADESELAAAEAEFFGIPVEEPIPAPAPSEPAEDTQRFAPVARPVLDEIVGQAKENGKDPVIRKDDRSGISLVDVSNLL